MKKNYTDEHARAGVDAKLPEIETWPNQYPDYEIEIDTPEFTSVCPKTGLPDSGNLLLRYVPDRRCLELKSYKMYLLAYRNLGIFQENVVNRVLRDVVKAAKPVSATVIGDFSPRGGLGTVVTATWSRKVESAELIAILQEVRDRVRARNPQTAAGKPGIPLPDLMPLLHARDAAMGKVAAIGSVNPRPGGLVNSLVQGWKRLVARVLDWHVREQVEFNRKIVACVDAALDAITENNRVLAELGNRIAIADELTDIKHHWVEWSRQWERTLQQNEVQFLRSVADLQGAFQHRTNLLDANYRDLVRAQHKDFEGALERFTVDIQKRLWSDLEKVRMEFERLIHTELRLIRQRTPLPSGRGSVGERPSTGADTEPRPLGSGVPTFDYTRFAERFRGSEEYVKAGQQVYLSYFQGRGNVLDIGCGRGEFLEMMRAAGVPARGIDLSEESVSTCKQKGLEVDQADLFEYLAQLPESTLDGIFCAQVVEHLPPVRLPEMIKLAASRLARNGVIAIETPNPECLAIFATHFYLDPTHTRPVPHPLLSFYLEEFGVGSIEVKRLSPAVDSMRPLAALPEEFRESFFGALDYAIVGKKL